MLSAGDRLGRYEILAPVGAAAMGEVYRARDTELERDVAIKVLPEAVSQNPDRLARFRCEAKAVVKLAHPNILDVFELGEHEGRPFTATEIPEGETLRECLQRSSLGWRKAAATADPATWFASARDHRPLLSQRDRPSWETLSDPPRGGSRP